MSDPPNIIWVPADISDEPEVLRRLPDGRPVYRKEIEPDHAEMMGLAEPPNPEPPAEDDEEDDGVRDGMTLEEIKAAGLQVDLPYESGTTGDFPRLQYDENMGDEKGWTPPEGFKVRHVDYDIPGGELAKKPEPESEPEPTDEPEELEAK